jgi:hypothetical protein
MDTITVTPKTAPTLASPKVTKNTKPSVGISSAVSVVEFGCGNFSRA